MAYIGKVYKKPQRSHSDDIVDALAIAAKAGICFFALMAVAMAIAGMVTQ